MKVYDKEKYEKFKPDADQSMQIAKTVGDLIAGEHPAIQGAVLADVMGTFLAGHNPDLRKIILAKLADTAINISKIRDAQLGLWDENDTEH